MSADKIASVLVMMSTVAAVGDEAKPGFLSFLVEELFHRPTEAAWMICVDGLEDEKNRPGLEEDDGSDEGGNPTGVGDLVVEFGRGCHNR